VVKMKIILLILTGIILIGCSKTVEENLPKEPPKVISNGIENPPIFRIVSGDHGTPGTLDKYCWEEEEKTCALEATPPKERLKGIHPIRLDQEEKITFSLSTSELNSATEQLIQPDKIELIQTKNDEESTFEVKNKEFTAPNEKGIYYYSAILTFDGDIKGEAIYAFSLSVR
jgi:hypothetical protein